MYQQISSGSSKKRLYYLQTIHLQITLAQSAGAVKYTDCTLAEG